MANSYPFKVGKLAASELNNAIEPGNTLATVRVGCILRRAANQSVNSGAATNISWDTEDEDTHGFWSAGTATTITIPTGYGGLYSASLYVNMPALTAATRVFASMNFTGLGTGYPSIWRNNSDNQEDDVWVSVADIYLPDAATIICDCFHNEGSAQNVTAWFSMHRRQE